MVPIEDRMTERLRSTMKVNLQNITHITLTLTFEESRHRFLGLLDEVRHRISTASPGFELAVLASHAFELTILTRRLGLNYSCGPIVHMLEGGDRWGVLGISFALPRGGLLIYARMSSELSTETKASIAAYLEGWRLAAQSLTAKHFRPGLKNFAEAIDEFSTLIVHEMRTNLEAPQPRRRRQRNVTRSATGFTYGDLVKETHYGRTTIQGWISAAGLDLRMDSETNQRIFTLDDLQAVANSPGCDPKGAKALSDFVRKRTK